MDLKITMQITYLTYRFSIHLKTFDDAYNISSCTHIVCHLGLYFERPDRKCSGCSLCEWTGVEAAAVVGGGDDNNGRRDTEEYQQQGCD